MGREGRREKLRGGRERKKKRMVRNDNREWKEYKLVRGEREGDRKRRRRDKEEELEEGKREGKGKKGRYRRKRQNIKGIRGK